MNTRLGDHMDYMRWVEDIVLTDILVLCNSRLEDSLVEEDKDILCSGLQNSLVEDNLTGEGILTEEDILTEEGILAGNIDCSNCQLLLALYPVLYPVLYLVLP